MNNVVAMTTEEKADDLKRSKAIEGFNALFARWLRARATVLLPEDDDEAGDRQSERLDALTDKIIHTPAVTKYQIGFKFEAMRVILDPDHAFPPGTREMLESIYADLLDMD